MPDLDQIKQREQGAGDWRERLPRASRARPRDRRDRVNRDEGGNGMRFASDSLQITARPAGGRNGLDRLASHPLEQISINLAVSLRGAPCATTQLDRSSVRGSRLLSLSLKRSKMVQGCDWVKRCPGGARPTLPALSRRIGGSRLSPGKPCGGGFIQDGDGLRCACGPCRHSP